MKCYEVPSAHLSPTLKFCSRKRRKQEILRQFSSLPAPCTASLRFANVEHLDLASVREFHMVAPPATLPIAARADVVRDTRI